MKHYFSDFETKSRGKYRLKEAVNTENSKLRLPLLKNVPSPSLVHISHIARKKTDTLHDDFGTSLLTSRAMKLNSEALKKRRNALQQISRTYRRMEPLISQVNDDTCTRSWSTRKELSPGIYLLQTIPKPCLFTVMSTWNIYSLKQEALDLLRKNEFKKHHSQIQLAFNLFGKRVLRYQVLCLVKLDSIHTASIKNCKEKKRVIDITSLETHLQKLVSVYSRKLHEEGLKRLLRLLRKAAWKVAFMRLSFTVKRCWEIRHHFCARMIASFLRQVSNKRKNARTIVISFLIGLIRRQRTAIALAKGLLLRENSVSVIQKMIRGLLSRKLFQQRLKALREQKLKAATHFQQTYQAYRLRKCIWVISQKTMQQKSATTVFRFLRRVAVLKRLRLKRLKTAIMNHNYLLETSSLLIQSSWRRYKGIQRARKVADLNLKHQVAAEMIQKHSRIYLLLTQKHVHNKTTQLSEHIEKVKGMQMTNPLVSRLYRSFTADRAAAFLSLLLTCKAAALKIQATWRLFTGRQTLCRKATENLSLAMERTILAYPMPVTDALPLQSKQRKKVAKAAYARHMKPTGEICNSMKNVDHVACKQANNTTRYQLEACNKASQCTYKLLLRNWVDSLLKDVLTSIVCLQHKKLALLNARCQNTSIFVKNDSIVDEGCRKAFLKLEGSKEVNNSEQKRCGVPNIYRVPITSMPVAEHDICQECQVKPATMICSDSTNEALKMPRKPSACFNLKLCNKCSSIIHRVLKMHRPRLLPSIRY